MKGGGVRCLDGAEMTDLPAKLEGIENWRIHPSPWGPLGYGSGVFELDDDMRPVRWLIRPSLRGKPSAGLEVLFLQRTFETLGVVVRSAEGAMLQVYPREGMLLNEAPLGRPTWAGHRQTRLIALGSGYLWSDRQLVCGPT